MVQISACPDVQQWQRLLHGQFSEEEAEILEQHLAECAACLQTVRGSLDEDTLVDVLHSRATSAVKPLPETVQRLIQRLKELQPASEEPTVAPEAEPGSSPDRTAAEEAPRGGGRTEDYDFLAPAQGPDELGRLGSYRVLKVLGTGGMGVVFEAEDPDLKRPVALKVMKPVLAASDSARQRFLREARTMAALNHDHIVSIHQVGEDRGLPFLAMPLLQGESLDDRLRRAEKLSFPEILRIARETAEGLAEAHERGLIHRDIKPSNLWLEGSRGRVKILDFGLARAEADGDRLTPTGMVSGTPGYMAPEQIEGKQLDARCDLFSLGCVLYRLCTGGVPFQGATTLAFLFALSQDQPPPPRALNPDVPADLSDLVMRLLAKGPAERPQTARAVVQALEAIEHEQTVASMPSVTPPALPVPQRSAFRRRRRLPAAVAASVLFAGILLFGAMIVLRTKHGTVTVTTSEPDVKVFVDGNEKIVIDSKKVGKVELAPGEHELTVRRGEEELFTRTFTLKSAGEAVIEAKWEPRQASRAPNVKPPLGPALAGPLDRLDPRQIPAEERFAWQPKELVAVLGTHRQRHFSRISQIAWSPDGKLIACGGGVAVSLFDAATLHRRWVLPDMDCSSLAFSPDGNTVACGLPNSLVLWDLAGAVPRPIRKEGTTQINVLAFARDGKTLATFSRDKVLRLWDISGAEPKEKVVLKGNTGWVSALAFASDGKTLVSLSEGEQMVRLWDLHGEPGERAFIRLGEQRLGEQRKTAGRRRYGGASYRRMALSPDGKTLALSATTATLRLWDLSGTEPKERPVAPAKVEARPVWSVAFSPDGRTVALGSDRGVTLWEMSGEPKLKTSLPGTGIASGVAFSPDSRSLATGGSDCVLRQWDLTGAEPRERFPLQEPSSGHITALASVPGKSMLVTATEDGTVRYWDLSGALPREEATVALGEKYPTLPAWGQPLAFTTSNLWDLTEKKATKRGARLPFPMSFSSDGSVLAGSQGYIVSVWDVRGEEPKERQLQNPVSVSMLALSGDGRHLACSQDQEVRLWDLSGPVPKSQTLTAKVGGISNLALSPDSKTLVIGGAGRSLDVWDVSEGTPKELTVVPTSYYRSDELTFSPDGKALVARNAQEGVLLWDTATWRPRGKWLLPNVVSQAAFVGDSRHLALGNVNGTVYILRTATPAETASR